jgi:threonine synthase
MEVFYRSTRDKSKEKITASQAILQGLSPDGGLYVPTSIPQLALPLDQLATLSYQQLAFEILKLFFTDFSAEELKQCITRAYGENFDSPKIAPLVYHDNTYYLELFHGPTIAFKDIALQLLPYLMTTAAKKNSATKKILILTATSGDTGKAAMEGFANVPNTKIIVFYPQAGVSAIQERQMLTQKGINTFVFGINGNFDDAQASVKNIFNDSKFKKKLMAQNYQLSSANSINIGRLFPQVVYYFYAYGQLLAAKKITVKQQVNFSVPTGNFGDILAGYYAKKMGLPINKLICASNQNNVLTDFFNSGTYDKNRPFYVTSSPSMDILISSNLERLLFYLTDGNPAVTADLMQQLQEKGTYTISQQMKTKLGDFVAGFADEAATKAEIKAVFENSGAALDPHTAVAAKVAAQQKILADQQPLIVVATASPYKFPQAVLAAITEKDFSQLTDLAAVKELKKLTGIVYPSAIKQLFTVQPKNRQLLEVSQMRKAILKTTEDN